MTNEEEAMIQRFIQKTGGFAKDMTVRDYLAAKAMQAIVAHPNSGGMTFEDIAQRARLQADALLKELS